MATPAKYRRLLGNPNTRAAVPSKYLPKALLRKRLLNRSLDAPLFPGADLTRRELAHNREAATGLRYGDVGRTLQQRVQQNQQQQTRDAGWFDQYTQAVQAAEARQQAQAAQANQQIQALSNAGTNASNQQRDQLVAQMQADAAARGATVDPSVAQTADQASAVRRALTDSFGAMLATQGAAGGDFLRSQELAGGQAKLEHLNDLLKQRSAIDEDISALSREKGAYGVSYEQDQRDAARKRLLENQAFGLDTQKAAETARDRAHRRSETRRHNRESEANTAASAAERARHNREVERARDRRRSTAPDWLPTAAQNKIIGNIQTAAALIRRVQDKPTGDIRARLRDPHNPAGRAFTEAEINSAMDIVFRGGLSSANVRALHGLRVPIRGRLRVLSPDAANPVGSPARPD